MEKLETWVSEKFSPVENKNVVLPDLGDPLPFPKESLGRLAKFVPIQDKDVLTLYWVLPYMQKDLKC